MTECASYKATAKRLGIAVRTVKAHVNRMYLKSLPGSTRLKRIQIVVNEVYAQHPELVPFSNGDRAAQINQMPAEQFAARKLEAWEHKTKDRNTTQPSQFPPFQAHPIHYQQLTQSIQNVAREL